jgi:hypothetical protein
MEGTVIRETVASLIEQGDRLQMADPEIRRELAAWTRVNGGWARDGVPGYARGFGAVKAALGPLGKLCASRHEDERDRLEHAHEG